ncbi:MAG TPA: zinc finger Ran-binding domain-containing protein [Actinomycetota bacterium]|nr:zinc finger Ran-binding domain-containing protein [Actinomycetota bacterium]
MSPDRRCPNCGALVSEDAEWCGQCFTNLREPPPAPPVPAPAVAETAPATDAAGATAAVEPARPEPEEPVGAFWPCPVCGTRNPIVLEACEVCGTPFAVVMRGDTRREADPDKAFRRSLLYPGLGHAMLGRPVDGFARGAVFTLALLIAILLPLSGVPTTPLTILAIVLSVAAVGGIYAMSAVETKRLIEGRSLMIDSRFLLWGGVGLMMMTVGAIALSVASETRR